MNTRLDSEKMNGLLPAVVQDSSDGEVLMVGFMNSEALGRTLQEGYVTFFSRTRNRLWMKGESSGNRLHVVSAHTDCDRDTLLFRVEVEGAGVSIDLMRGKIVQLVQGEKKALEFDNFDEWVNRFSKYKLIQLIDLDVAMGTGSKRRAGRGIRG